MHANTFDRYEGRDSLIHGLDPRIKVIITVLFIVSNVLLPDGAWLAFAAAWGLVLFAAALARLSPVLVVRRSFIAIPFALAAVSLLFTYPGRTIAAWQIGAWSVTISDSGLVRFTSILLRSWLSVQMAILLTATTQFPDLMHALRHLRVPSVLISIIGFTYRYLFTLADEARRLLRARAARSARPVRGQGGGTLLWRARVAGSMVGQLFLRSFERSERVYKAMVARGYRGQLLTMTPHNVERQDWLFGAAALLSIVLIQGIGHTL